MERATDEERVEAAQETFARFFSEEVTFESDRALVDELRHEAGPAIESLVMALSFGSVGEESSLSHHECLAMLTLLGRRAAILGLTPSGVEQLLRALRRALEDAGFEMPVATPATLRLANLEGYVRGREEALREAAKQEAESAIRARALVDGVWYLPLHGPLDAEALVRCIDEFARVLHRREARAAIIDLTSLPEKGARLAAAIGAADESCRMLGVPLHFAGVDDGWGRAFQEAGGDALSTHVSVQDALRAALSDTGWTLKRPFRLRRRR